MSATPLGQSVRCTEISVEYVSKRIGSNTRQIHRTRRRFVFDAYISVRPPEYFSTNFSGTNAKTFRGGVVTKVDSCPPRRMLSASAYYYY